MTGNHSEPLGGPETLRYLGNSVFIEETQFFI
jgi:hypothetical protein